MGPNTHHGGFSICCVVRHYMHNSKTKARIRLFYLSNDCSTIRDIYSLGYSCIWINISKLWVQTRITNTFQYDILCVFTLVTQKLQVICGHSTYRMTAILSKMSIFCVRAEFEKKKRQVTWCTPPSTHCSLFQISHSCIYCIKRYSSTS